MQASWSGALYGLSKFLTEEEWRALIDRDQTIDFRIVVSASALCKLQAAQFIRPFSELHLFQCRANQVACERRAPPNL